MTDEPLFRVILPNGKKTKPYTRAKIESALKAGKLPTDAVVGQNGVEVSITEFIDDVPRQPQPLVVNGQPPSSWKSKLVGWVIAGTIGLTIGFLSGTESQKKNSLTVEDYELTGLYLDKAIYERAVKEAEAKGLTLNAAHFRSSLAVIDLKIARGENRD